MPDEPAGEQTHEMQAFATKRGNVQVGCYRYTLAFASMLVALENQLELKIVAFGLGAAL